MNDLRCPACGWSGPAPKPEAGRVSCPKCGRVLRKTGMLEAKDVKTK